MVNRIDASRWSLIVFLAFLVSGCASMDEDECRVADWRAIGYEDGVRGVAASHIGERREACAEHGIAPDFAAYRQGRDEGLLALTRKQTTKETNSRMASIRIPGK
jgi:hypothetical protein